MPFRKLHGLGNDFIVVDGLSRSAPVDLLTARETAVRLCDRHRGIGADGVLLVLASPSPDALAQMRVINSDGSESEMCGNGIRCVAKLLHDHLEGFRHLSEIPILTGAGVLRCALTRGDDGLVRSVRVDMGRPGLEARELPMQAEGRFVDQPIQVGDTTLRATAVSMGNPHLVTFAEATADVTALAAALGPSLERHPRFPQRTNVEFARPAANREGLDLAVWERGCGLTLACGTGACATAVAATVTGRHPAGRPLPIHLPGGTLDILVAEDLSRVWMEGPATMVFEGEVQVAD
ncbi:MAG: diaminopimelate epimerase [Deltaproteobacteria bacterium]|nr:diaminopimelate epimerase [Deltaproteobacteria bacterium]